MRTVNSLGRFWLLLGTCLLGCANKGGSPAPVAAQNAGTSATSNAVGGQGAAGSAGQPSIGNAVQSAAGSGGAPSSGSGGGGAGQAAAGSSGQGPSGGSAAGSGASGSAGDDGGSTNGSSGAGGTVGSAPPGTVSIDPPVADSCITSVAAGDHTFTCQGLTFLVMVGEQCTKFACGLIFDVHGAAMSGEIMRTNNQLHVLAPPKGYLVVHPNASSSTWDLAKDPPILADFMTRMIAAFHVDKARVHMTGFSMGSAMTFWFLCNHPELLASAGPVTGASAEQATVAATGAACIDAINATWKPRVPILFMSGSMDNALTIMAARARTDGIVMRLGLTGGDQIAGDASFTRKHWVGDDGMVFDFLEHNYSNAILAGHCIPGGSPSDALFACTSGGNSLDWGKTVLEWFIDHPKR
jgi:pimeloyl-ACP methyl ester carboxylesterase